MSPAEAAGTPYGAATALLHAQVLGRRRAARSRRSFLSLFDHGDRAYDSAVFIDNLHAHDAARRRVRRRA